jgi:microcystin degradation protein MlrC
MRVAIAGLFEEVNTFAVETMGLATITGSMSTGFQKWEGQALIDEHKGTQTYIGGFIAGLEEDQDVEIVPTILWSFSAGPTIEGGAYATMKQEIVDALVAAQPLDAVLLQLHGAGVAQGVDDIEADLAIAIRAALGPDVKIAAAMDLHANVSPDFRAPMDLVTAVHLYPHTDMYEAALRAARLVPAMVRGEKVPHGHFEHLPLILQLASTLDGSPYADIRRKVQEFAARPGIFEFSNLYCFALADVPYNTVTVNCWAESQVLAEATAREFAQWLWDNRERFFIPSPTAAEAVDEAQKILVKQGRGDPPQRTQPLLFEEAAARLASDAEELANAAGFVPDPDSPGPVIIAEVSDNQGGGAPGDATHVLWELIHRNVQQAAVCTIRDAATVKQAMAAGVGAIIDVELGGKLSKLSGEPVRGKAYVKSIADGKYTVRSPMGLGARLDTGPAVGLVIEGIDVAVISGIMQAFDHGQMKNVGFDPRDYRVVVVKSSNHFRAWWSGIASAIVDADPPGLNSNNLASFAFTKKRGKVYPLDKDAQYP